VRIAEADEGDEGLEHLASRIYGRRLRALTPALAKRLTGQTVPGISGQGWMDYVSRGTREQRARLIHLHTVHGVFEPPPEAGGSSRGWFSRAPKAERASCALTEVYGRRVYTWAPYLFEGHFGTGSGHDPVFVFV
jgi:hypothetical protein